MTISELRDKLDTAIDTYNSTPARDHIASAQAKRNVTRIKNQIAKLEAESAKPVISFVSSTLRSSRL